MKVRRADFAGSWYPGRASDCLRAIEEFVSEAVPCGSASKDLVGGIVPHAGWFFSGRIACNVLKCLHNEEHPDTFLIFGRHLHPASKNYIMMEGAWATPLGNLELDVEIAERLETEFPFAVETPERYEPDNTIELQLPFIKHFFPDARIVPMGLGPAQTSLNIGRRAAEICVALGRKTLVIGSTDLTHYGYNYGYSPKGTGNEAVQWVKNVNDRSIVNRMLELDGKGVIEASLRMHNACCGGAAGASIEAAKALGSKKAEELVYSTSFDIRPDTSFVGYVGLVFSTAS